MKKLRTFARRLGGDSAAAIALPSPDAAKAAGLRYVSDGTAGLHRHTAGKGFAYVDGAGKAVRDAQTLKRIRALAIPPAWTDVWICKDALGHLQATGRDARGRKQYRYHPLWRTVRDRTKYHRMIPFAVALPHIRERVERDLNDATLCREKVLAAVVRLLEETLIRVGNEEYAQDNHSFGLTTLRSSHVQIQGPVLTFHFRGKSGKMHTVSAADRRVARIVRQCQELPGHELFQYVDAEGKTRDVHSDDVNAYLREISGDEFTAKDFRTWAGTVYAALTLRDFPPCSSDREANRNVVRAIEKVANRLGNTPAICKKCYVHPGVVDAYLEQSLTATLDKHLRRARKNAGTGLHVGEAAVLALLRECFEE